MRDLAKYSSPTRATLLSLAAALRGLSWLTRQLFVARRESIDVGGDLYATLMHAALVAGSSDRKSVV